MFGFSFGFGFNKEKSRAKAEGYLQQNKLPNAITEYEKILQVEPHDLAILNTVGDIYSRLGQIEKAIERFRIVGESYATDGYTLKSIAMYKKITKLDPNGLATMEKLAELYRKQGLVSDARSMLLQAAEAYTRKGQSKETLRLLKQLVLFDPENVQVITRTADLMTQSGQKKEAMEMLSQTASKLIDRHALEPAQKVLDRLIALDRANLRTQQLRAQVTFELGDTEKAAELYEAIPDLDSHPEALNNLLSAYLKLGRLDEALLISRKLISVHHDADGALKVAARLYKDNDTLGAIGLYNEFSVEVLGRDKEDVLAHLHGAVARMRNHPQGLELLYKLFQRAGEDSMIPEVLELLAHACVQANQLERARDAYKELIELEPDSAAHLQGYRQVCARLNPVAPADSAGAGPTADDGPHSLEEFLSEDEPVLPRQSYPPPVEEKIAAALTEAELCESFSSKTGGIAALEFALQSAPEDLRLNRSLGLLYRQAGDSARAARCYAAMQRALQKLGETQAAEFYGSLANSGQTTTWEAKGSEFAASDFDLAPASEDADDGNAEEIDLSSEWESVFQESSAEASGTPSSPAEAAPATPHPAASPEVIAELFEEVRFCLAQQIWDEAETAIARLAAASPDHPELPALCSQLRSSRPSSAHPELNILPVHFAPVEVIEVGDSLSTPTESPAGELAPLEPPPAPEFTLNSLAAELDLELGDNFEIASQPSGQPPSPIPPAAETVAATAAQTPVPFVPPAAPPPPSAAPQAQPQPQMAPYKPPLVERPTAPEPVFAPSVFGDLLQNFEADLAAPEENDNDPETHFNLGIAFREMGLLDEAIGELQKVCRMAGRGLDPARAQQAYIWLATCFVEKSVPEAALKWFLRALEAAPDEESRTAVNYELASAYEAAGRKREALDHFMEVYDTNIDYRDVATRIRELRASV